MPDLLVRDYQPTDTDAILRLNAAHMPEVGSMDLDKLRLFEREAKWLAVVESDAQVVGFAVLLTEGAQYASPNFRWFTARHDRFLYVDRIAIAVAARGRGVGQRIYRAAVELARNGDRPFLCAEVNTIPPNPASLRFHQLFGFEEVSRRCPYEPESEVAMLEYRVAAH